MRQQAVDQALEKNSMDGALEALGKSIARWTEKEGLLGTAISALSLARRDAPTEPTSYIYEPSLCVIAQGVKRVMRVPRNAAVSTVACLARRRCAISRPCVTWRAVRESRGALSKVQQTTISTGTVH